MAKTTTKETKAKLRREVAKIKREIKARGLRVPEPPLTPEERQAIAKEQALKNLYQIDSLLGDAHGFAGQIEDGHSRPFCNEALARACRLMIDEAARLLSDARQGLGDKRPSINQG